MFTLMFLTWNLKKKIHYICSSGSLDKQYYWAITALCHINNETSWSKRAFLYGLTKTGDILMNWYSCLGILCSVPVPYFIILTLRSRPQKVWAHLCLQHLTVGLRDNASEILSLHITSTTKAHPADYVYFPTCFVFLALMKMMPVPTQMLYLSTMLFLVLGVL